MIVEEKPGIAGFSYTVGFSFTITAGVLGKLAAAGQHRTG
jgi:hypothetical protein